MINGGKIGWMDRGLYDHREAAPPASIVHRRDRRQNKQPRHLALWTDNCSSRGPVEGSRCKRWGDRWGRQRVRGHWRPGPTHCRLPCVETRQSREAGQTSSLISVIWGSNASHEGAAEQTRLARAIWKVKFITPNAVPSETHMAECIWRKPNNARSNQGFKFRDR